MGGTQGPRSPLGSSSLDAIIIISTRHVLMGDCPLPVMSVMHTGTSPTQECVIPMTESWLSFAQLMVGEPTHTHICRVMPVQRLSHR